MNYETTNHIVNVENLQNKDNTLTDVKLYIEIDRYIDGDIRDIRLFNYETKTVSKLLGDEVIISNEIDQSKLGMILELANNKINKNLDYQLGNNSYDDIDLGGWL